VRLPVDNVVVSPQHADAKAMLKCYGQCAEAFPLASVEAYRWLVESVAFPAVARFECLYAILGQYSNGLPDSLIYLAVRWGWGWHLRLREVYRLAGGFPLT
jgi:hypothetical protein